MEIFDVGSGMGIVERKKSESAAVLMNYGNMFDFSGVYGLQLQRFPIIQICFYTIWIVLV